MQYGRGARHVGRDFAGRCSAIRGAVLSPKCRRARLGLLVVFSVLWLGVIVTRLASLQITDFERWQDWAVRQHSTEIKLASERGPVVDREGRLLAVSVPAGSVWVRPRQVKDVESTATNLAKRLGIPRRDVMAKLTENKPFVWLARQIPRSTAEEISAAGIPGVGFFVESKRYYPYKGSASTLIGRVGIDGIGLSGLERVFNTQLHGEHTEEVFTRDAMGKMIHRVSSAVANTDLELPRGESVQLTIDADLQLILDEELEAGKERANAKHAMGVLVDADTGEILAMGQSPGINLNNIKVSSEKLSKELRNLAVETVFEPGSIFKPLVAAAALEEKMVTPYELIDCEKGRYAFGSHTIKDTHPSEIIPFRDVIVRSSNIGMAKIGARLGADKLYGYLRKFGFGEDTGLGLPGETKGILRPVSSWAKVDVATHSFGQGVAVTPLQVVRAMSAIANGGKLPRLRVIMDDMDLYQTRILSERTTEKVRDMMYGVVEDKKGTGGNAAIAGVRIGGKTGTAQKARLDGRGYEPGAYVASFVGFADASALGVKKKLALIVMVDEPNTDSIYGGTLAAPVFKRVMQRSLYFLATRNELDSGDLKRPSQGLVANVAFASSM